MRLAFPSAVFHVLVVLLAGCVLAILVSTLQLSLIVGGALAVGFLLLFLAQPMWGLLFVLLARASTDTTVRFLTAAGPRGEILGGQANIGLMLVLTIAGGIYILSRRVPMISLTGGWLLALLLVTGFVGMMRSNDLIGSMRWWIPVLATLVIYALAAQLFSTPRQIQRAVDVIAASFIFPAALGMFQLVTGEGVTRPDFPLRSVTGPFVHPSAFGQYLVLIVALFLGQALSQTGKRKVVAVGGLCVAFLLLFGTYARAAWLGALIVLLTIGILRARAILLLLVGALITLGLVPALGGRLADVLAGGGSLAYRLSNTWPGTLHPWLWATEAEGGFVVAANRLAGLGPGIGTALGRYGLTAIPHNDYLRILVEYGVFGLVLYLALIGVLATMAFNVWRQLRGRDPGSAAVALSFFALTLAFSVMSLTDNVFAQTANQVYFWTLAGLTVAVGKWGRHSDELPLSVRAVNGAVSEHGFSRDTATGWH